MMTGGLGSKGQPDPRYGCITEEGADGRNQSE